MSNLFRTRPESPWTDEKVERLKSMVAQTVPISAAGMAAILGMSRNAILGKIYRLGLSLPRPPGQSYTKPKPRPLHWTGLPKRRSPTKKPPVTEQPILDCVPLNIPFEDLQPGQCKYPYGEVLPYLFCGLPTDEDKPYCAEHLSLCCTEHRRRGYERPDVTRAYRKAFVPIVQILHADTIEPIDPDERVEAA